jgi:hypothetical protein
VGDKAIRVAHFHEETVKSFAEILAAAGYDEPGQLMPQHVMRRSPDGRVLSFKDHYPALKSGELLNGAPGTIFAEPWSLASSSSFSPSLPVCHPEPVAAS